MKTLILSASVAAFTMLVAVPVPVLAHTDVEKQPTIECEWQPQAPGPRAPLSARVCKKVADQRERAIGGPECDPSYTGKTGRYVWRSRPQYGPHAPLQAPVRVWVDGTDVC